MNSCVSFTAVGVPHNLPSAEPPRSHAWIPVHTEMCVCENTCNVHENMLDYTFLEGRAMPPVIDSLIHQMFMGSFEPVPCQPCNGMWW